METQRQPEDTTPFLNRSRSVLLGVIVLAIVVVVVLMLMGRLVVWTEQVSLPAPVASAGTGDVFYISQFDGPIRNASPSEAKQGTAQVSLAVWNPGSRKNLEIFFQLWHAEKTGIKNLRVTLTTPNDWGGLLFSLPEGDGWGPMLHKASGGTVTVQFDKLGWSAQGYVGTLQLRFYPEYLEYVLTHAQGDTIHAEVDFDVAPTDFPRFRQWHVHGTWQIPALPKQVLAG